MNCSKCGTLVEESAIYCGTCGARVDGKKSCPTCGHLNTMFFVHGAVAVWTRRKCAPVGRCMRGIFVLLVEKNQKKRFLYISGTKKHK